METMYQINTQSQKRENFKSYDKNNMKIVWKVYLRK